MCFKTLSLSWRSPSRWSCASRHFPAFCCFPVLLPGACWLVYWRAEPCQGIVWSRSYHHCSCGQVRLHLCVCLCVCPWFPACSTCIQIASVLVSTLHAPCTCWIFVDMWPCTTRTMATTTSLTAQITRTKRRDANSRLWFRKLYKRFQPWGKELRPHTHSLCANLCFGVCLRGMVRGAWLGCSGSHISMFEDSHAGHQDDDALSLNLPQLLTSRCAECSFCTQSIEQSCSWACCP